MFFLMPAAFPPNDDPFVIAWLRDANTALLCIEESDANPAVIGDAALARAVVLRALRTMVPLLANDLVPPNERPSAERRELLAAHMRMIASDSAHPLHHMLDDVAALDAKLRGHSDN